MHNSRLKIPSYLFTHAFTMSERRSISERYSGEKWDYAFFNLLHRGGKISKSAVSLCEKIDEELGLLLFPYIENMARKGYSDAGQIHFQMISKDCIHYNFDHSPREYLAKKSEIIMNEDDIINNTISII